MLGVPLQTCYYSFSFELWKIANLKRSIETRTLIIFELTRSLTGRVVSLDSTNCKIYLLIVESDCMSHGEFLRMIFLRRLPKISTFKRLIETKTLINFELILP